MSNDQGHSNPNPAGAAQATARKTDRVYAKRVPSALTPDQQRDALREVRAGRSVHQVAADKSVSESVILELWHRDTQRKTREFLDILQSQITEIDDELRGRKPRAHKAVA